MKAERQHKEATSRVIQPSKGGGGYIVDNRPETVIQTKLKSKVCQMMKWTWISGVWYPEKILKILFLGTWVNVMVNVLMMDLTI